MGLFEAGFGIDGHCLEVGTDAAQAQIERAEGGFDDFLVGDALFLLQTRIVAHQPQRFCIGGCGDREAVAEVKIVLSLDNGSEIGNGTFQRSNFGAGVGSLTADAETSGENYGGSRSPFKRGDPLSACVAFCWQRPIVERLHAAAPGLNLAGASRARGEMSVEFASSLWRAFAVKE
jgi:hypothetical protein